MSVIRWLHISDLHLNKVGIQTDLMRGKLMDYVKKLSEQKPFDYIFCTGDIRTAPKAYPDDAISYFNKLCSAAGVSINQFFIVPGNHDVNRSVVGRSELIDNVGCLKEKYFADDSVFQPEALRTLKSGLVEYVDFIKNLYGDLVPGAESAIVHTGDNKKSKRNETISYSDMFVRSPSFVITTKDINIVHVDSTLIQGSGSESGLILGSYDLLQTLKHCDPQKPTIILSHYSIESLERNEQDAVLSAMKRYHVQLWLAGHEHEKAVRKSQDYFFEFQVGNQAWEYETGSSVGVVTLDTEKGEGFLQIHNWNRSSDWAIYQTLSDEKDHSRYTFCLDDWLLSTHGRDNASVDSSLNNNGSHSSAEEDININVDFLNHFTEASIANLGGRYIKDFNLDVSLSKKLEIFCANETIWGQYIKNWEQLQRVVRDVIGLLPSDRAGSWMNLSSQVDSFISKITTRTFSDFYMNSVLESKFMDVASESEINKDSSDRDKSSTTASESELIKKIIHTAENESAEADEQLRKIISTPKYYENPKARKAADNLRSTSNLLDDVIKSTSQVVSHRNLLLSQTMIVDGNAGVGKSHSIARHINLNYLDQGRFAVLILGQYFKEDSDPIQMMERMLHLSNGETIDSYLGKLNECGEKFEYTIPFVIEGINEAKYPKIWKDHLNGLIALFSHFPWVKLVISIRSTYEEMCIPAELKQPAKGVVRVRHMGFAGSTPDIIRKFFDYYEIKQPAFPILGRDFANALFLHTMCKALKSRPGRTLTDYSSFNKIFEDYIDGIEEHFSRKFGYLKGLRLVRKAITKIIESNEDKGYSYQIPLQDFYDSANEAVYRYGINTSEFIEELCGSGLFYREISFDENEAECFEFAYERYENIVAAKSLLFELNSVEKLQESINDGRVKDLIRYGRTGILEELFIQGAEKYNEEIFSFFPQDALDITMRPYIEGLVWRNGKCFDNKSFMQIFDAYIFNYVSAFQQFVNVLLTVSIVPGHPLNSKFSHRFMMSLSMADRDYTWTEYITEVLLQDEDFKTYLSLSEDYDSIEKLDVTTKLLMETFLSWLCTTTDIQTREEIIRHLTILFENDLANASKIIKLFSDVNDGYVKEAIYTSIYGALLRSTKILDGRLLSKSVYEDIFDVVGDEEVYPHLTVRSHAQQIIKYLQLNGEADDSIEVKKIEPPYNSQWFESLPSNDVINTLEFNYSAPEFKDIMWGWNTILSSMATEGEGSRTMYGDYGRYVFQGLVRPWKYKFNPQMLSNQAVLIIKDKYGYNYKKHGEFDNRVRSFDRGYHRRERIGKKYQRIATDEILARLADNFEMTPDFYYSGKPVPMFPYEGPWQITRRGIDTSVLMPQRTDKEQNFLESIWTKPTTWDGWASNSGAVPDVLKFTFTKYEGEEFVTLVTFCGWKDEGDKSDSSDSREYFSFASSSVLALQSNVAKAESSIQNTPPGDQSHECYSILGREFYWSDAYRALKNEYLEEHEQYDELPPYKVATIDYMTPNSYSNPDMGIVSNMYIPSESLVNGLGLRQAEDGKWINKEGKLIAIDLGLYGYQSILLFRKEALSAYLKSTSQVMLWNVFTEQMLGQQMYDRRMMIQWDGDKIQSKVTSEEGFKSFM